MSARHGDAALDAPAGGGADGVRGEIVERIGHRQLDGVRRFGQRQDVAVLEELDAERAVEQRLVGEVLDA